MILRFPRLAPFERCQIDGDSLRDVEADRPARIVEIFDVRCEDARLCYGSAGWRPGRVPYAYTEYELVFDGYWRISEDSEPIILT